MPDPANQPSRLRPDLSVVVPLFNEEESVGLLYSRIVDSLQHYSGQFELIFVDDGSTDNTRDIIRAQAETDHRLKLIGFRRNYGQTPAMAAGIDYSSGHIIVTMDGDLQNDPSDILMLVEKIFEGFDLVVGWRHKRKDKLVSRKIPSVLANWLIGKVTGVPIRDNGCSLKAYRAGLIKQVPLYSEMHRFIPAMSAIAGAKIAEVKVKHHSRQFGASKYGLSRIYKVLFDLLAIKTLTTFSSRPLMWFGLLSVPFALAFMVAAIWSVTLVGDKSQSLVVSTGLAAIFLSGASFLVTCGILSELIYKTGQTRPTDFFAISIAGSGADASMTLGDQQHAK